MAFRIGRETDASFCFYNFPVLLGEIGKVDVAYNSSFADSVHDERFSNAIPRLGEMQILTNVGCICSIIARSRIGDILVSSSTTFRTFLSNVLYDLEISVIMSNS